MKLQDIKDEIASLGVSKPVYRLSAADDNCTINFTLKNRYQPPKANTVLEHMVRSNYSESFNKSESRFVASTKLSSVYRIASESVLRLYIKASPLKNPHLGGTYKWLRYNIHESSSTFADGILSLFSYALDNCARDENGECDITDFRFDKGKENPHLKNIAAILDKIRETYER